LVGLSELSRAGLSNATIALKRRLTTTLKTYTVRYNTITKEKKMDNSNLIAGVLQRVGQTINAQLTLTWDTKQTLEQYLEILEDNEDDFSFDSFVEYVLLNAVEDIILSIQQQEPGLLEKNLRVVDSEGTVLY
jgi:hypothetical protein